MSMKRTYREFLFFARTLQLYSSSVRCGPRTAGHCRTGTLHETPNTMESSEVGMQRPIHNVDEVPHLTTEEETSSARFGYLIPGASLKTLQ